ncbi:hypothetical protein N7507_005026 [Penicillium longicatenatum]|nr:hypothetical protein N7507_005026 [Penicillium longicatenatum]
MPLPLKKEMDNYYIFPKVEVIYGQPRILWETPINGSTLDRNMIMAHATSRTFIKYYYPRRYTGL